MYECVYENEVEGVDGNTSVYESDMCNKVWVEGMSRGRRQRRWILVSERTRRKSWLMYSESGIVMWMSKVNMKKKLMVEQVYELV